MKKVFCGLLLTVAAVGCGMLEMPFTLVGIGIVPIASYVWALVLDPYCRRKPGD